ncbi:Ca-activated chloride channel family protein [Caldalkalibacillus uzonensis]|uniref:Ca-activated chloride channel family protein n=1 Tax=Caldalkalibacillus uzonensis TaxID=353224 RepID=A0ABU0CX08_9BACI|nr:VWA domain-containing protein [Caldalkalibacillus uzonensis]MDQ0340653.1 Ca-activated chloride channel family protein [Caldalkalibacillus uzonensis]
MSEGTLKQILLITDGCSNEGKDPVAVAAMAREQQITVNVIGILDDGQLGEQGIREVQEIAAAAGGIHQVVYSRELPKTVQMVTRQAMTQTIQQVVNKELQQILGREQSVEALPPDKRGQVVEVVEHLGETLALDVLILVDTSASMKNKIPAVKQALRDLKLSLQSRTGENRFSLWTYPYAGGYAYKHMDFSTELDALDRAFGQLTAQGTTPTGPALEEVLYYFTGLTLSKRRDDDDEGMLRRYVF